MKKKVIIHGAYNIGFQLSMRINYIFDIVAFFDRKPGIKDVEFDGIPIFTNLNRITELDFDYIFVMVVDYDGVVTEYERRFDIPRKKMLSMLHVHHRSKCILFQSLANEISRLNVPGAVAEVGVDFGDTSKYINLFFNDRELYLFDTFTGFSQDDINTEISLNTMNDSVTHHYDKRSNEIDVLERMFFPKQCKIKKGYFPDSLEGLEENFAFVHIDCDLSKPINAALEYFYPRMSKHGYICVHDYFNPLFRGVRSTVRDFVSKNNVSFTPIPQYCGIVICKHE